MLYLGHFSFDTTDSRGLPLASRGFFTAVVEASGVEEAINKFRTLITKARKNGDLFERVYQVFLDACVEVRTLPECGLLSHFVEFSDDGRAIISTSAPGVSDGFAVVYGYEEESNVDDELKPFLIFE